MSAKNVDEAIALVNNRAYGNMACIFTSSGTVARKFRYAADAGNIGVNIGVAAPMAYFPFSGWNESFFGDLHAQSHHGVEFYTQTKVVVERWPQVGTAILKSLLWAKCPLFVFDASYRRGDFLLTVVMDAWSPRRLGLAMTILIGNAPCSWGTLEFEGTSGGTSPIIKCWMNWWRRAIPGRNWAIGGLCPPMQRDLPRTFANGGSR